MWKLEPGERISHWREFRKSLDSMSLDQAVQATAEFWQSCPFNPYYLDSLDPTSWPNAWDLIAENYYCDLAKALGIVYTMHYTKHKEELTPELQVYTDPESGYTYNLSVFSKGKYILNLKDGEVVNIESINKNLNLGHSYNSNDLRL